MTRALLPFVLLVPLFYATVAWAGGIAVVDFQRAVNETTEGKTAQKKLESMYSSRKAELLRQQQDLATAIQDYEQKKLILNDDARRSAEQAIYTRQSKLETDLVKYEQEMQEQYMNLVSSLDGKMRTLSATIAKEKGYDVVLDQAAVIYAGGTTVDMTAELIRRYNLANPGTSP
jgi:outer membrane protein